MMSGYDRHAALCHSQVTHCDMNRKHPVRACSLFFSGCQISNISCSVARRDMRFKTDIPLGYQKAFPKLGRLSPELDFAFDHHD